MIQKIVIEPIELIWSDWYTYSELLIDARISKIELPESSGVYEACLSSEVRLTIGKANNLRHRVRQGLVKGKIPHSSGQKIRENLSSEEQAVIKVRWAQTNRPSAIEEELHKQHVRLHGKLPIYTQRT